MPEISTGHCITLLPQHSPQSLCLYLTGPAIQDGGFAVGAIHYSIETLRWTRHGELMSEQKERPILFNGEMVRAILEGRKTVTRRVAKFIAREKGLRLNFNGLVPGNYLNGSPASGFVLRSRGAAWNDRTFPLKCPFGLPGDRLWVRETFARVGGDPGYLTYRATYPDCLPDGLENIPPDIATVGERWIPSIHMPRAASRILLEITDVRVERLQAITEEQARAEGIIDGGCTSCGNSEPCGCDCPSPSAVDSFYHLWKSTGGDWDSNPWVWVVEFKRVDHLA